jgi:pimeloyl-ACP methyl ester carboxylesterase
MTGNLSKHAQPVCRRALLKAGGMLGVVGLAASGSLRPVASAAAALVEPFAPVPMPQQVPVREGLAQLPGGRLWFWDTGGDGDPIVLLHPASGSALIWGYQQPAFAKAGHRVIAYSRRGYFNSDPIDKSRPGTGSQDLHDLVEFLGIGRFHLVASAAGGSIASDYAFSRPERLRSLTVSSNSFGVVDGDIFAAAQRIRPRGWDEMPVEFREVGPSYRGANPDGFRLWVEIARKSYAGDPFRQPLANRITEAKLGQLRVPTLVICGAADLATPPSIARMLHAKIPDSELLVAPETGHSVYWEQPDLFNRAVLDLVAKHAG